jgi:mitogen-activated protein kinase 7
MLTFDPSSRTTVTHALEHPWLAAYHDPADEPDCPVKFEQWREIENLETVEAFREAIWKEIEEYRREVRGLTIELSALCPPLLLPQPVSVSPERIKDGSTSPSVTFKQYTLQPEKAVEHSEKSATVTSAIMPDMEIPPEVQCKEAEDILPNAIPSISPGTHRRSTTTPTDPVKTYSARRSSLLQSSLQGSTYNSPLVGSYVPTFVDNANNSDKLGQGTVVFPSQGYVAPVRSRTGSTVGNEVTRKLLRTLSTVSIHEGLPVMTGVVPMGITQVDTEADAPPSEVTKDFGFKSYGEEEQQEKDSKKGKFIV